MPKTPIEVKQFSASEKALFAYLDEMLREGTESPAAAVDAPPVNAPALVEATPEVETPMVEAFVAPTKSVISPPLKKISPSKHLQDLAPAPQVIEDIEAEGTKLPPIKGWNDNGRPSWAQSRFDALLFKVAGLKLAVPLVSLGLIHPIDKKFNALPHQTPWFLGLLRVSGGTSIKVIDTAMCVMPERYTPACREGIKYVITLHGYDWGLACHEVDKAITLDPTTINWRTQRGKRPWMAGTVRDHMCALIDSAGFHSVIDAVEQHKDPPKAPPKV